MRATNATGRRRNADTGGCAASPSPSSPPSRSPRPRRTPRLSRPPPGRSSPASAAAPRRTTFTRRGRQGPRGVRRVHQWYAPTNTPSTPPTRPGARLMPHIPTAARTTASREQITPLGIARGQGDELPARAQPRASPTPASPSTPPDGRDEPGQQRLLRVQPQRLAPRRRAQHHRVQERLPPLRADPARRPASPPSTRGSAARTSRRSRRGDARPPDAPGPPPLGPADRGLAAIAANSAARLLPGRRYVDWVGTDFYPRFPPSRSSSASTPSSAASPSCSASGPCGARDNPGFVKRLFGWSASPPRVRMLLYNQGAHRRPVPPHSLPALARRDPRRSAPRAQRGAGGRA